MRPDYGPSDPRYLAKPQLTLVASTWLAVDSEGRVWGKVSSFGSLGFIAWKGGIERVVATTEEALAWLAER